MGNEKNWELTDQHLKSWVGGHSNLRIDVSATTMKIFVTKNILHPDRGEDR